MLDNWEDLKLHSNLKLIKFPNSNEWRIFTKEPHRHVGSITDSGYGIHFGSMKLACFINPEFRNMGIMTDLLREYLNFYNHPFYEVAIKITNLSSLKLAQKNGFIEVERDDDHLFLVKK